VVEQLNQHVVEVVMFKAATTATQTPDPSDRAQHIRERHGNALMGHNVTVVFFHPEDPSSPC